MFGIANYGASSAAMLLFLALPEPGALLSLAGQGGFCDGAAALASAWRATDKPVV